MFFVKKSGYGFFAQDLKGDFRFSFVPREEGSKVYRISAFMGTPKDATADMIHSMKKMAERAMLAAGQQIEPLAI